VLIITATVAPIPRIAEAERATASPIAPGFWRVAVRYGFMERPNLPRLLASLQHHGCSFDMSDVTYYVGRETITARTDGKGLPRWQEMIFAAMERNAAHATDFFALPTDRVVEIGRQISI
jgi:KUP system potassium uptake protein